MKLEIKYITTYNRRNQISSWLRRNKYFNENFMSWKNVFEKPELNKLNNYLR
jgi:hypothetical protein